LTLSEIGQARVHGYLFVLLQSLKTFLPPDTVSDAVREIESHLRERVDAAAPVPDERATLEKILNELGPPLRVAQAYSAERTIDEAVTTGRFVPILRAIWHLAATTIVGFFAALGLFVGYITSFAFFAIAVMKPIFPANVGVQYVHGFPVGISAHFPVGAADLRGGYGVIPFAVFCGLGILVGTHRGARAFLRRWREKRVS
jgi:uncharacterized membrane protein